MPSSLMTLDEAGAYMTNRTHCCDESCLHRWNMGLLDRVLVTSIDTVLK